jgi:hypothetical protein
MDYPHGPLADVTGRRTAVLLTKYAAPTHVTDAAATDVMAPPAVRVNFADDARTYPVHTPAAAWVSAAAYHDAGAAHPTVGAAIKRACDAHGLTGEWERLEGLRPGPVKAASAGRFALPAERKYPLDTAAQVTAAAAYHTAYAHLMPADARQTYAAETVKAAAAVGGLSFHETCRLEREAGLGRRADDWERVFVVREKLAAAEDAGLVAALAEARGVFAKSGDDCAPAAATVLRALDRARGWKLSDPLEGLIGWTPAAAKAALDGVVKAASGAYYARADLDRVPDDVIVAALGLDAPVLDGTAKAAALSSATTGGVVEQLLADVGVKPVNPAPRDRVTWTPGG